MNEAKKIVVFDEVYILFHFNIILKHNGMPCTKQISLIFIKSKREFYELFSEYEYFDRRFN